MQNQAQSPATPTPPAPQAVVQGPGGVNINIPMPMTRAEVRALQARRNELSNQLTSAQGRRADLAQQLARPNVVDQAGLEAQVKFLDNRILGIENDIAENGRALASIPANLRTQTTIPAGNYGIDRGMVREVAGLMMMTLVTAFGLLAVRRMWRRAPAHPPGGIEPARWEDGLRRMERLESAIEAIAVEVERVGEGQRFITRVLAEPAPQPAAASATPAALGAGDAPFEPVRVPQGDAAATGRRKA